MKMTIETLATAGLEGNLSKGVSAAYAAVLGDQLIVAGGCNFPDKLGFEGGKKVFYNDIVRYDAQHKRWEKVGELPEAAAYGVSVQLAEDTALWVGGTGDKGSMSSCYKVHLGKTNGKEGQVILEAFPSLPVTLDNFAGVSVGSKVFVVGGAADGKSSNALYTINPDKDTAWRRLADFTSVARVQPVLTAGYHKGRKVLYLLGGFFWGGDTDKSEMATEVLCYDIEAGTWSVVGETKDPESGEYFSLTGATARQDGRYIACFGGVNHDVFIKAITDLWELAHNKQLSEGERKAKTQAYMQEYMTRKTEDYRFNKMLRLFDTEKSIWHNAGEYPELARAGATLIEGADECFYLIQGELRPGVRSNQTFRCKMENKER